MKFFLSILLFTTAFYVLPVKETLTKVHDICYGDMDADKEENNKNENLKELFTFSNIYIAVKDIYRNTHCLLLSFFIPVLLHTVENPPPDLA